jgi:hypothetical protein
MKKISQSEFDLFAAVEINTFEDSDDLIRQISEWTKDQLYTELDGGISSLDANWIAADTLVQDLSKKVKEDIDDLDEDVDLVKIKVKIDIEIVRNGR